MSIRKRISKLEMETGVKSGICECKETIKYEIHMQEQIEGNEFTEPEISGKPVPEICPLCKRSIEKQVFILQLVHTRITPPAGRERF
jgi:hypothetical protein